MNSPSTESIRLVGVIHRGTVDGAVDACGNFAFSSDRPTYPQVRFTIFPQAAGANLHQTNALCKVFNSLHRLYYYDCSYIF